MTIHIFNPEHDIALASNLEHFTAPHAGRELRHDLGFLPALWAKEGDLVLVDDVDAANEGLRRTGRRAVAEMVDIKALRQKLDGTSERISFKPWGWDLALRQSLKAAGVNVDVLPGNVQLNTIRHISHRAWAAANVLKPLRLLGGTVGEAVAVDSVDEVRRLLARYHDIVLKAPWSSSGRGVRYVSDKAVTADNTYYGITPQLEGWMRNVIMRQGCVMVEPYYNKVVDFGMEFFSDGVVEYKGLSLFHTANGAYTGNVIESEDEKEAFVCRYIPQSLLSAVRGRIVDILSEAFGSSYAGPFGIDMMVVRNGDVLALHPCVELNLRMTMGHVALLIGKHFEAGRGIMRIVYVNGRYSVRLEGNG